MFATLSQIGNHLKLITGFFEEEIPHRSNNFQGLALL